MQYADRVNNPKYQSLYKRLTDAYNSDIADWFLATRQQADLDHLQSLKDHKEFIWQTNTIKDHDVHGYGKYKSDKKTTDDHKKDAHSKEDTVHAIKAFMRGHRKSGGAVTMQDIYNNVSSPAVFDDVHEKITSDQGENIYPRYGKINHAQDIAKTGDAIKTTEPAVGASVFGLAPESSYPTGSTDKFRHAYRHLAHLMGAGVTLRDVEMPKSAVDEYSNRTQLEDLDPYTKDPMSPDYNLPPMGYDNSERVYRDLTRDDNNEIHAQEYKIGKQVMPDDEMDRGTGDINKSFSDSLITKMVDVLDNFDGSDRPAMLKELRATGASPFIIDNVINARAINDKYFNGHGFSESQKYVITTAIRSDQARPVVDKMYKHPNRYGSDKRLKNILQSVQGVI